MDTAYIFMLGTFALAVVCGFIIPSRLLAVSLPSIVPLVVVASRFHGVGPRAGEALLFIAPFVVGILLMYGVISYVGVRFGRWLRPSFRAQVKPP